MIYLISKVLLTRIDGSRATRPKVKECIRSGDQEATLLTSFLIG